MLFDAQTPAPPRGFQKLIRQPLFWVAVFLVGVIIGLGAYHFWNFREEHAVSRFLTTLEQGKYREAYGLWQPAPDYSFNDFMRGWGEQGDYGKIHQFQVLGSRSRGRLVIVTVRINNVDPPLELLVDCKTLGLAYSIF